MAIIPVHCPVLQTWCGACVDCWRCVTLLDALEELGILEDTGWVCPECCIAHDEEFILGGFYSEGACIICHKENALLQICINHEHLRAWKEVILREPTEEEPEVEEAWGGYEW
tara:strand:- start:203 stop:541 length:339 start_codon:yes stop_codon:yes gene_type:complete